MEDIRKFCPLWGEWEVDSKLGSGSFGEVWKMRRTMFNGQVYYSAVKHISIPQDEAEIKQLLDENVFSNESSAAGYYKQVLQSLVTEIDTMHKLRGYTNIVSYEDHKIVPKENGIGFDVFLRMELLTPILDKIRQGMTTHDVVKLGKDMATAISVLNKHQLIHRDIKPQNIFVNETGDYKLGDYGTARALITEATSMSRKGTYNYMAPEIYKGAKADISVDIYSLGIVMYRLLNGNRLPLMPLTGDITYQKSEEVLIKRMEGAKLPAPQFADERLAQIVLKACAYLPDDRYHNAEELLIDLQKYQGLSYEPVQNIEIEMTEIDSHQFAFGRVSGRKEERQSGKQEKPAQGKNDHGSDSRYEQTSANQGKAEDEDDIKKSPQGQQEEKEKSEEKPFKSLGNGKTKQSDGEKPITKTQPLKWIILAILVCGVGIGALYAMGVFFGQQGSTGNNNTEMDTGDPTITPAMITEEIGKQISTETITEAPDETSTENAIAPTETVQVIEKEASTETITEAPTNTPIPVQVKVIETETTTETIKETPIVTITATETPEVTPTVKPTDTPTPIPVMVGDVNGDQKVDLNDVVRLQKYVSGWDAEIDAEASDVNGDGVVDLKDLVRLQKMLAE